MKNLVLFLALLGANYLPFGANAQSNQIKYSNNVFRAENLGTPGKAAGAINDPFYGDFFWEFGDGNYSTERSPNYQYASSGPFDLRLSLTPFYSTDLPKTIPERIPGENIRNSSIEDDHVSDAQMVHLFSNANNRLIPENEIQVVIHYKIPTWVSASTKGYLMLFFNQDQEANLKFAPFLYPEEKHIRTYFSETPVDINTVLSSNLPTAARTRISDLSLNHDVLAFECPAASAGTARRLFLSMTSVEQLKKVIPEKKQKKIDVTLKAIWVPDVNNYQPDAQLDQYVLTLLRVHDPNKIRVRPRKTNYKKDHFQALEYEIQFQNKGQRPVEKVTIEVPFPINVNYDSIEIVSRKPNAVECRKCPPNFNPDIDRYSCFEIDTLSRRWERIVIFTFRNISVHGTKEDGVSKKKYTKGNLVFKVWSNNVKEDLGVTTATIIFEGGKAFTTNKASTRWRQKTVGGRVAYNFPGEIGTFRKAGDEPLGNLYLGVYYQNAPIKTGLGWGAEIGYNRLRFESDVVRSVEFPDSDFQSLQVNLIDLKVEGIYQRAGIFRVGAGAGLSSLLAGTLETVSERTIIRTTLDPINNVVIDVPTTFNGATDARAGLFVKNKAGEIFGESFTTNGFAGWFTSLQAEVGLLNTVSLGVNYEFRYYPSFYNEKCASFSHWQVYLRTKLYTQN